MSLKQDLKSICLRNKFHGRIIVAALYFEYRISKIQVLLLITLLFKIFRKLVIQGIYHCDISPISFQSKTAISTLRLPHPYLIIVHANAKLQNDITLFHNVTIGVIEGTARYKLAPVIRNNVYIGTGTSILGDIHIEEGCKIGAHSLILKSISEKDKTIVGIYK